MRAASASAPTGRAHSRLCGRSGRPSSLQGFASPLAPALSLLQPAQGCAGDLAGAAVPAACDTVLNKRLEIGREGHIPGLANDHTKWGQASWCVSTKTHMSGALGWGRPQRLRQHCRSGVRRSADHPYVLRQNLRSQHAKIERRDPLDQPLLRRFRETSSRRPPRSPASSATTAALRRRHLSSRTEARAARNAFAVSEISSSPIEASSSTASAKARSGVWFWLVMARLQRGRLWLVIGCHWFASEVPSRHLPFSAALWGP
jgi:hypothetical protein